LSERGSLEEAAEGAEGVDWSAFIDITKKLAFVGQDR